MQAKKWCDQGRTKLVIFFTVLRRTSGFSAPVEWFTKNMGLLNDKIWHKTDVRGLCMKEVTGFNCHEDDTAMQVHEWSPDGADTGRLFDDHAFQRFIEEIHAAYMAAVPVCAEILI